MNPQTPPDDGNPEYLTASLAWLRLKLERIPLPARALQVATSAAKQPADAATISNAAFWHQLFTRPVTDLPATDDPDPQPVQSSQRALDQAAAAREVAAQADPPPALITLGQRLGLTAFEKNVLLLCAALELDTRIAGLCARAQADASRPYPTFALALALFDEPAWEALSPDRPLRYWRLIEINQPGAQALTTSALRADERIVNYLKGLNDSIDDRLALLLKPLDDTVLAATLLPPSQQDAAQAIIANWKNSPGETELPVAQLLGHDSLGKQLVIARTSAALGLRVFTMTAETLPTHVGDLETLARLWQRESALQSLALYLDAQEVDTGAPELLASVQRFLTRADGIIFLGVRENWQGLGRPNFSIDIDKPTTAEQQSLWQAVLGEQAAPIARQLAAQFNLNAITITQIFQTATSGPELTEEQLTQRLWATCSATTRPRLDALAQRIDLKVGWDNLVLPVEQANLLRQISSQVGQRQTVYEDWGFAEKMNRGLGISALFAGESGTGKTMAAEVIANDLQLNLYRIDLSAVVSKYIGETEKNLRRLFDAAEDGGAILFFDEADAMFGKRSEVKDSHDRYANIEVNYLLQRMESYRGLAILATNMKTALDTAFIRRLRFIVNFPFPGPNERKAIWQKVFPERTPLEDLDYDRLARFNITGGNIHSIALNAAFIAAQAGEKISMPTLFSAIRTEYRKLDKPVNEAEFR